MLKVSSIILLFLITLNQSKVSGELTGVFSVLIQNTPKRCLGEVYELAKKLNGLKNNYNSSFDHVDILYNRNIMTSLIEDLRKISNSINSSNCSTIIFTKYILDGTVFIGDKIYGDAFSCISNEDLESKFFSCSKGLVPENSDVLEYLKPVGFCVAQKLDCSQEDRKSFVQAVYAGVDLFDRLSDAKSVLKSIEKGHNPLVFKPEVYDHLMD
ncbi:hypothetical protein CAEBREN_00017 [Caenorhabditis brenneri]|uniref:DUF19 domain-containing protein n=1 Tax=Caenorhabditis brenneri TaxID=135651 RepID=G0PG56_CAEBE|nr:hypothetical protein CAEBREN_00017 [Caenorhabditis brenneri]